MQQLVPLYLNRVHQTYHTNRVVYLITHLDKYTYLKQKIIHHYSLSEIMAFRINTKNI